MARSEAEKLLRRRGTLKAEHLNWRGVWDECARYCMPLAAPVSDITVKTRGGKKKMPVDTSGVEYSEKLSAWLYSSTVYSGEKWVSFRARLKDSGTRQPDVALNSFLQEAAYKVLETISDSNFVQIYQQFLRGYVAFGTGVFYSEFDEDGRLQCRHWNITDGICIAENSRGEIDTVFREFVYSARQAVQEFGYDEVSADIRKAYDSENERDKTFNFLHCVFPRTERNPHKKGKLDKKFADVYIEIGRKKIVREGGHDSMPYQIPRFYNTGEVYGRSPAMSAIPAMRAINIAMCAYMEGVEFSARPVGFFPSDTLDDIEIKPGAKNPWDSESGDIKLWSPTGDLRSPLDFADMMRGAVQRIFYNDVFQYLEDRKNMTATEAQLRYDEMIQGFAPVLANLQSDFFGPFLERIAMELCVNGTLDVPTAYRKDAEKNVMPDFEVVYTTRLDTKIKGVLNGNMRNFAMLVGEFAQIVASVPLIAAYIDSDKYIKMLADNCDCNDILQSEEEIKKGLDAMNIQQQQQALMGKVDNINLQETPAPGSALDILMKGGAA